MSGLARLGGVTFLAPTAFPITASSFLIPHSSFLIPPYPFTPVNEMPSINNRCAKKKSTTMGSMVTSEAAIK